jgi:transposase
MMRKTTIRGHIEQDQILREMQGSQTRGQFQRWQAIYLVVKGLRVEQVAEYVGVAKGTIHQWVFRYNHQGPESFSLQGRGGRRFGMMSIDEEAELLESIRAEAHRGEVVGAFWLREMVEKKLGHKVSKDYLYDLLHRHGWRKVVPLPRHPKADVEKQEEFKKNSRSWWQPPVGVSRQRTSGL